MVKQSQPAKLRTRSFVVCLAIVLGAVATSFGTFSNTADVTWMTNGIVYSIAQYGNTIYIGGRFTSVRACPVGTTCTGNIVGVNNLAAFDATTGVAIRSFRPAVTGGSPTATGGTTLPTVYGLAVLGGKLFIGGSFTTVAGQPRMNFAAVDAVTGALDPTISAPVGADATVYVRTVIANSSRVYIAGDFSNVGSVFRQRFAAFDAFGTLDSIWKPRASALVHKLAFSCDGVSIFAGGNFRNAAGSGQALQPRATLAKFDAITGALDAWATPSGAISNGINALDIAPTCDRLFVGYGGSNHLIAVDISTDVGNVLWDISTGGDVQAVAVRNDRVLFGGHFANIHPIGEKVASRTRFAVVDFNGAVDPWDPAFDGSFFGPWAILVTADNNHVWVGGAFLTVSGVPQSNIARFTDTP